MPSIPLGIEGIFLLWATGFAGFVTTVAYFITCRSDISRILHGFHATAIRGVEFFAVVIQDIVMGFGSGGIID